MVTKKASTKRTSKAATKRVPVKKAAASKKAAPKRGATKRKAVKRTGAGPRALTVKMHSKDVVVYAGARVADALDEVMTDMTVYRGVRLAQVLEAVYEQGKRDGARQAFGEVEQQMTAAMAAVPHRNPGRPRKRV